MIMTILHILIFTQGILIFILVILQTKINNAQRRINASFERSLKILEDNVLKGS